MEKGFFAIELKHQTIPIEEKPIDRPFVLALVLLYLLSNVFIVTHELKIAYIVLPQQRGSQGWPDVGGS